MDSSKNIELPFIDDEAVPEDDLDDDETTLTGETESLEQPENTAKMKSGFIFKSKH